MNVTHSREADIRAFVNHYFSTWSQRDTDGYGACFDPQAHIYFIGDSGKTSSYSVSTFVQGQTRGREQSGTHRMARPVEVRIRTQGDAKVVQVIATWVLTKGASEEARGTDFFTLKHDQNGWKILSLVYYGEWW